MKKFLIIPVIFLMLLGFSLGTIIGLKPPEKEFIEVYVPYERIIYKTVEKVVKEVKYIQIPPIETIEYVYLDKPRLFKDKDEVRKFVRDNYNEWRAICDERDFAICVDYAVAYQYFALNKGFLISTENEIFDDNTGHAFLSAWTQDGDCIYWDVDSVVIKVGAIRGDK